MEGDDSMIDQEVMSFSSASLIDTNMPISTTPTNINAIILNSQIPGAQRLCTVTDSDTSPATTCLSLTHQGQAGISMTNQGQAGVSHQDHTAVSFTQQGQTCVGITHQVQTGVGITHQGQASIIGVSRQGHTGMGVARQGQSGRSTTHQGQARIIGAVHQGQTGVGITHQGKAILGVTHQGQTGVGTPHQGKAILGVAHQGQGGVVVTHHGQTGVVVSHQDQSGVVVAHQGHAGIGTHQGQAAIGISHQGQTGIVDVTRQGQAGVVVTHQGQSGVVVTHQGQSGVVVTQQNQPSVGISQAQMPIISTAGTTLRLPQIVAVEGGIKPDISLCSRVLKSFSDQDQASSDLEVQSVMFPETRGLLPTVKRICPSRSSSSSKSSKSSYSPMRQPTTLTNAKRGNVQTTTPTFLPEDMTIHQLAAQGELSLLSERMESLEMEKVDKTDVQFASSNGNVDVVRLLLAENIDVNNYDWNGGTPLLYAVYNNHPKCCELLLQAGADMTIETDGGHTALSIALALGHKGVQQVIEKHMLGLLQRV
ncbi:uncharacterized protein [Amphiura filiformis]|uniref:uncharacterized protein n=1 Tax=Amphiura filiformis TaxID=82378 RepID=UPI003B223F1C